jgi:Ca2+-binding RTX toxin-like protein
MSTFQLTGNVTTGSEAPGQTVSLYLSLPDSVTPTISYTTEPQTIGAVPRAEISAPPEAVIYLANENIFDTPHRIETYIVETTWAGNETQLMYFNYFDAFNGAFQEWTFEIRGTLLPRTGAEIDIALWQSQLTAAGLISSGPLQPNTDFNINQVLGATQVSGMELTGDASEDTIRGGYDNDTLIALGGDDTVFGGNGNDVIRGGKQEDRLNGGNGADQIFGQRNADIVNGNAGNDTLNGGGGNDTLSGGDGNDFAKGGTRDDMINGGTGSDRIIGNSGKDTLNGGNGNDTLNAGGDADRLNGGTGNDALKGGAGADTFVFSQNHGRDVVADFDASEGDVVQFRGTDAPMSFEDIIAASQQQGADLLITTGTSSSILLENTTLDDLSADAFDF